MVGKEISDRLPECGDEIMQTDKHRDMKVNLWKGGLKKWAIQ